MWDPRDTAAFEGGKRDGRRRLGKLVAEIAVLQTVMWAENRHKLLVVLQAMDPAGRDPCATRCAAWRCATRSPRPTSQELSSADVVNSPRGPAATVGPSFAHHHALAGRLHLQQLDGTESRAEEG